MFQDFRVVGVRERIKVWNAYGKMRKGNKRKVSLSKGEGNPSRYLKPRRIGSRLASCVGHDDILFYAEAGGLGGAWDNIT